MKWNTSNIYWGSSFEWTITLLLKMEHQESFKVSELKRVYDGLNSSDALYVRFVDGYNYENQIQTPNNWMIWRILFSKVLGGGYWKFRVGLLSSLDSQN